MGHRRFAVAYYLIALFGLAVVAIVGSDLEPNRMVWWGIQIPLLVWAGDLWSNDNLPDPILHFAVTFAGICMFFLAFVYAWAGW